MPGKNGTKDQETDKEELEPSVPTEAMDNVDMELPSDYEDELLSQHLLQIIGSFHVATAELRAFRQVGDSQGIDRTSKQVAAFRAQAALIQYEHPNTVALYKRMASKRASEFRIVRENSPV